MYRLEDAKTGKGPFAAHHEEDGGGSDRRWGWRTIESALDFMGPEFRDNIYPLIRNGFTMVKYVVTRVDDSEEDDPNEAIFNLADVVQRQIIPPDRYLKKKYKHHTNRGDVLDAEYRNEPKRGISAV